MKRTNSDTTPPAHWVEIFQQTIVHLAEAGFAVAVGNSKTPGRLTITVEGLRRCALCGDLTIAAETINDHCRTCQRA